MRSMSCIASNRVSSLYLTVAKQHMECKQCNNNMWHVEAGAKPEPRICEAGAKTHTTIAAAKRSHAPRPKLKHHSGHRRWPRAPARSPSREGKRRCSSLPEKDEPEGEAPRAPRPSHRS